MKCAHHIGGVHADCFSDKTQRLDTKLISINPAKPVKTLMA